MRARRRSDGKRQAAAAAAAAAAVAAGGWAALHPLPQCLLLVLLRDAVFKQGLLLGPWAS